MEKRIYKETPLNVAVRVVAGVIGFLLFLLFLFTFVIPSAPSKSNGGLIGLGLAIGVMILTLLIAWLVIKKHEVTVDLNGAQVIAKRPLGRGVSERFLWRDVTDTFVESITYTIRNSPQTSYKFGVSLNDGRIVYLFDNTFLDLKLRNLVRDVNQATKEHLGCVWEECRADEKRSILAAVPPFCKIALTEEAARDAIETKTLVSPASAAAILTVSNPAAPKPFTKKQHRQSALSGLSVALLLWAIAAGLSGWDYYLQKQSWERIPTAGYDFNTGKSVSVPKPPFAYLFGDSGLLPVIIIVGGVGGLMFAGAVYSFSKWRQTVETPKMIAEDARLEKIENSPEVKEVNRKVKWSVVFRLLVFAPIVLMLVFKAHYSIYFSYLIFAALAVGVQAYLAMRR